MSFSLTIPDDLDLAISHLERTGPRYTYIDHELLALFEEHGSQRESADPVIISSYYSPGDSRLWFATEFDPDTRTFYGFVSDNDDSAWREFRLDELADWETDFSDSAYRDHNWRPINSSEVSTIFDGYRSPLCRRWLSDEQYSLFRETGSQKETHDPLVIAAFFSSQDDWEWLATEFDPIAGSFYGYVYSGWE